MRRRERDEQRESRGRCPFSPVWQGTVARPSRKIVQEIRPWLAGVARLGFAAKGAIYVGVGVLALALAAGFTAEAQDTKDAIEQLGQGAFGRVLLWGLAFGLLNFGLWNLVQSLWDPERVGVDWIGQALRVLFGLSAGLNFFLATKTAGVALGRIWGQESGDEAVRSWTARVLSWPGGRVLVLLAAATVAIVAISQMVRLVRGRYMDVFSKSELKQTERRVVKLSAQLGFSAQAVLAGMVAWFLWRAGLTREASESGGFTQALATLLRQPYGRWLVGSTGVGIVARGLFIWLMVPYREIRLKQVPPGLPARWRRIFGY